MTITRPVLDLVELHEGYRRFPYRCTANRLTIGIGRNLEANGISREEARHLQTNDLLSVMQGLDTELPWWRNLSPVRQAVLLDMGFNLGISGLRKFTRTLEHIRTGRYEDAATSMRLSLWSRQVKTRAERLATMMATDSWPKEITR